MKNRELLTVGSRWRQSSGLCEVEVLYVGESKVFIRFNNGNEIDYSFENLRKFYTPIKETKELYLFMTRGGDVWLNKDPEAEIAGCKYRSEHPISFVEVE